MKKIFTFFAALACVMSMSAKVIYLKPNSNWQQANATFWVHAWGAGDKDVKMTPVEGDPTVYQAEVGESTSIIFMRRDPSKDASNVWDLWNRMGNLAIPADKNCCAIKEGEWTQEKEDASAHVTWSVYTPSTGGEDPDPGTGGDEPKPEVGYYITGNSELVGGDGWKANEIQMLENEGTYTHTFEQLQAGVEYKMKVTDGSWSKHWGYTALQTVPEGVVKDGDGNIVFKMAEASDLAVAFDGTNITLTGTFAEIELPTVVYNVTVPEGTKACYIAGAMNGWSQEEMTKVDDTHYTISIKGATTEMKYKYCSGPSWDYEEVTADGGKVEDRVYSENDVVAKWKAVYNPAGTDPGTDPTEIKYVLMGVGGDWANGIDMTANPDNADEYMLLGQTISEGDSVKVVRLEDGVAKHWCGAVKEGVTVNITPDDKMGNIILTPGLYDFYYDVKVDQIWIGHSSATSVDNVALENKAIKIIRNGQIYILSNGLIYNTLGQEVK